MSDWSDRFACEHVSSPWLHGSMVLKGGLLGDSAMRPVRGGKPGSAAVARSRSERSACNDKTQHPIGSKLARVQTRHVCMRESAATASTKSPSKARPLTSDLSLQCVATNWDTCKDKAWRVGKRQESAEVGLRCNETSNCQQGRSETMCDKRRPLFDT